MNLEKQLASAKDTFEKQITEMEVQHEKQISDLKKSLEVTKKEAEDAKSGMILHINNFV